MGYRSLVGLDIGHKNLRFVTVRSSRDGTQISNFGTATLDDNEVLNESNSDTDGHITETLNDLWKSSRVGNRRLVMGTNRLRTVIRRVSFPDMPEKDLQKIVGLEAERHLPIDSDNLLFDFSIASDDEEQDLQVILVGTTHHLMDGLLQIVRGARLNPVAFDVSSVAAHRALAHPAFSIEGIGNDEGIRKPDPEHAYILIDLGYDESRVSIFKDGMPVLSRNMSVGGRPITHSLSQAADIDEKTAEELKTTHGIQKKSFANSPLYGHVKPVLQQLSRQILQSLQFFSSDNRKTEIAHVYLHGGTATMPGLNEFLLEFLQEHARDTVNWLDDEPHISCVGPIKAGDNVLSGTKYLTAAGLALWGVVQ